METPKPEFNWGGLNPELIKAPEGLPQPEEKKTEFNWGSLRPEIDEESALPEGARNFLAGVHSGVTSQSFTASMGTYLESKMPIGRLFSKNKDGEIDFWQSTPEWLGMSEEEWDALPEDQRRIAISKKANQEVADHWEADPDSTAYIIGSIGGALIDPTTAIPVLGQTKTARTLSGAAIGAADVSAYELAQKGSPTLSGVALGAGLGGLAGRFLAGKTNAQISDEQVDLFQKLYPHQQKMTDDITEAYKRTLEQMGTTPELFAEVIKASGIKPHLVSRTRAAKLVEEELSGLKQTTKSIVPKSVDKFIQPISDRIRKISPRLWTKTQDSIRKAMELSHQTMTTVDPFLRKVERLRWTNKAAYRAIHKAMFEGDTNIEKLVLDHMGDTAVADLKLYRSAMDHIFDLSQQVNPKLRKQENYFPRWLTDFEVLKKELSIADKTRIDKIIADKAEKLKRGSKGLTEEEVRDIYNKYIQGHYDTKKVKMTPSGTKHRRVTGISEDLIEKAYARPAAAAHSYIKQMANDIYRKKMFGDTVNKAYGDNITDSIGAIAQKYGKSAEDIDELKTLYNLLYVEGTRSPKKIVQTFKDLGYSSLLGNPLSAITQIGDIFLSAGKIGAMNTFSGLAKSITGRGLSPKEFGLMDNVIEELVSTGKTKVILEKALSLSGFKAIDRLGKATLMNGALRKIHKQAHTKEGLNQLRKKWGEAFGEEWTDVENALRKGEINSNIKTMVFSELADIQPITLLEMPEMYLKHPNGRLAYMLRTFTMKFMNLLRRDMLDKFTSGDRKQAIINGTILLSALNAGGMTADTMKDLLLGRETDTKDTIVDNLIKSTGIMTRYSAEKIATSREPVTEFMHSLLPPLNWMDPAARAMREYASTGEVRRETKADVWKSVPVIGQLYYNYGLGGLEKYNRNR